jgi:hypothetical protein
MGPKGEPNVLVVAGREVTEVTHDRSVVKAFLLVCELEV